MSIIFSNVKVLSGESWKNSRGVSVKTIDIVHGTLKSTVSTSHTLQPTFKDHDFMQKIGFNKFNYETTISFVEMVGEEVKLFSHKELHENKGFGYVASIEISAEQLSAWAKLNKFITFIKDGELVI